MKPKSGVSSSELPNQGQHGPFQVIKPHLSKTPVPFHDLFDNETGVEFCLSLRRLAPQMKQLLREHITYPFY